MGKVAKELEKIISSEMVKMMRGNKRFMFIVAENKIYSEKDCENWLLHHGVSRNDRTERFMFKPVRKKGTVLGYSVYDCNSEHTVTIPVDLYESDNLMKLKIALKEC